MSEAEINMAGLEMALLISRKRGTPLPPPFAELAETYCTTHGLNQTQLLAVLTETLTILREELS